MTLEQGIGALFALAGVISLGMHVAIASGVAIPSWLRFRKLDRMRETWGPVPGTVLHVTGYVVVPIVFGLGLLFGFLRL